MYSTTTQVPFGVLSLYDINGKGDKTLEILIRSDDEISLIQSSSSDLDAVTLGRRYIYMPWYRRS
jgi:hypothetical protein